MAAGRRDQATRGESALGVPLQEMAAVHRAPCERELRNRSPHAAMRDRVLLAVQAGRAFERPNASYAALLQPIRLALLPRCRSNGELQQPAPRPAAPFSAAFEKRCR